jgi:hypothetical protein
MHSGQDISTPARTMTGTIAHRKILHCTTFRKKSTGYLTETAGVSNVYVTLSWDTTRSGWVDNLPDLRVARWNGSIWKDEGNGSTTGTNVAGTVRSMNPVSNFSPFTLASSTPLNPLPVTLLNFAASKCNNGICLLWSTENEQNFSHFELEKSNNGNNFNWLATVIARNQTTNKFL